MHETYEQLSNEALHRCQTWLDAWEVMTDVHMKVYELGKFKPKDFKEARKAGLLAEDTLI